MWLHFLKTYNYKYLGGKQSYWSMKAKDFFSNLMLKQSCVSAYF